MAGGHGKSAWTLDAGAVRYGKMDARTILDRLQAYCIWDRLANIAKSGTAMKRLVVSTLVVAFGVFAGRSGRADDNPPAAVQDSPQNQRESQPATAGHTVAIILGDGRNAPSNAWEPWLMEALVNFPGVQLVERTEIRHVLEELRLNASGLADSAKVIKVGALAAAEALVVLEQEPDAKPPLAHCRLIDSRSGASLLNWIRPAAEFEKRRAELAAALGTALAKSRLPAQDRRYVGVVGIHSEEPGRALDNVAALLGTMLEDGLQQLPRVIVLERKQLERLTSEHNLSGMELALQTSAMLVEGGVRHGREGNKLAATIRVSPLIGGKATELQLTLPADDLLASRRLLSEAMSRAFRTPAAHAPPPDPRAEAAALQQRALLFHVVGQYGDAARLLEAAWALAPDRQLCNSVLYNYYCFIRSLKHHRIEQLKLHLRLTEIALEHADRSLSSARETGNSPVLFAFQMPPRLGEPVKSLEQGAEELALVASIHDMQEQVLQRLLDTRRRFGLPLWQLHVMRLAHASLCADTPEEFTAIVRSCVEEIDRKAAAHRWPRVTSQSYYWQLSDELTRQIEALTRRPGVTERENREQGLLTVTWEKQRIRPLLQWLTAHKDPRRGWPATTG